MSTAHQPRLPARQIPGEPGIWMFVFGDMMMFSLFFVVFLHERGQNVAMFSSAQAHLDQDLGVLNTVLMLSSSWFVASAVHAARKGLHRTTPVLFMLAFLCGLGFAAVKFFEYRDKIRAGFTLTSNDFFTYYFMFTGIHLMHVFIGMGVLSFMALFARAAPFDAGRIKVIESGACFWHVVDLLWIVLFALLYLVK